MQHSMGNQCKPVEDECLAWMGDERSWLNLFVLWIWFRFPSLLQRNHVFEMVGRRRKECTITTLIPTPRTHKPKAVHYAHTRSPMLWYERSSLLFLRRLLSTGPSNPTLLLSVVHVQLGGLQPWLLFSPFAVDTFKHPVPPTTQKLLSGNTCQEPCSLCNCRTCK